MIYTVTMNPSVDFISRLEEVRAGRSNYSKEDDMFAGGRALNVSRILKTLDVPTTATGFVGGHTGAFIEEALDQEGILHDFIHTQNSTRLNLSLFVNHIETRILGRGADVSLEEVNQLMYYLSRVREGDFLVIAGSLPPNLSSEVYQRMVEISVVNGASFLPAIRAEDLAPLIEKKPLLITPTLEDLQVLSGTDVKTKEEAAAAGVGLVERGAKNVIVNMEREGSLFINEAKDVFEANGPQAAILSQTYTNMSLIAGFIGHYMRTSDPQESFRAAQAAANAAYYVEALPTREQVYAEFENVHILPYA